MKLLVLLFLVMSLAANSQTIYIVRHGEKAPVPEGADRMTASDPALSEAGQQRAQDLKTQLRDKNIGFIFSTDYKRTRTTVQPLSEAIGIAIQQYPARPDSMDAFIGKLKSMKGNIVVAGHSNTIDDLANKLAGKTVVPGDLPDTEYDNIFVLKREGESFSFERVKYGKATP